MNINETNVKCKVNAPGKWPQVFWSIPRSRTRDFPGERIKGVVDGVDRYAVVTSVCHTTISSCDEVSRRTDVVPYIIIEVELEKQSKNG